MAGVHVGVTGASLRRNERDLPQLVLLVSGVAETSHHRPQEQHSGGKLRVRAAPDHRLRLRNPRCPRELQECPASTELGGARVSTQVADEQAGQGEVVNPLGMEVCQVIDELGGVARRSALGRSARVNKRLTSALALGEVVDIGDGWLARPTAPPVLIAAKRLNATITCASAARFYELPTLIPDPAPHLGVPHRRGAARDTNATLSRLVVHRERAWTPPAATEVPLAPLGEVLARALRCLRPREAIVMIDAALKRGAITSREIEGRLAGPGSVDARITLQQCDGGSRSVIESLARLTLKGAGFTVRAGVWVPRVGEVDLLVDECVVVECDGFEYHSGRREYREDRRRDRELVAQGYVVLRFTYEEIMNAPEKVIDDVRRALRQARRPV